jgi:hypothetical protein
MVFFNASNPNAGTDYYDIPIENEPLLTDSKFTRFRLPINGNATKMILENSEYKKMNTYVDFYRNDLDRSVKSLQDQIVNEQIIENDLGKQTVEAIVTFFRNACYLLQEDPDNHYFFKNGRQKATGDSTAGGAYDKESLLKGYDQGVQDALKDNIWTEVSSQPKRWIVADTKKNIVFKGYIQEVEQKGKSQDRWHII